MRTPLAMGHRHDIEVFDSISEMVRKLAELAVIGTPNGLEALDRRMRAGSVVRVAISVGSAGPLGLLFQSVDPDGSVLDIVTIDAPPSEAPFRFGK